MCAVRADEVLRRRSDVRFRIVLDEGVIVRQESAEVLVVNEVGARALALIDGRRTAGEIADTLEREFAVEPARLRDDLASYLDEIAAAGIVEPVVQRP